jgi:hypothetical protein
MEPTKDAPTKNTTTASPTLTSKAKPPSVKGMSKASNGTLDTEDHTNKRKPAGLSLVTSPQHKWFRTLSHQGLRYESYDPNTSGSGHFNSLLELASYVQHIFVYIV